VRPPISGAVGLPPDRLTAANLPPWDIPWRFGGVDLGFGRSASVF
jgi:hypothetical protein